MREKLFTLFFPDKERLIESLKEDVQWQMQRMEELRAEVKELTKELVKLIPAAMPTVKQQGVLSGTVRREVEKLTKKFEVLDEVYMIVELDSLKEFLKWSSVNKEKYLRNDWDCDNFSIALWAELKRWSHLSAFGLCTITRAKDRHCILWGLARDKGEVVSVFIEPQTDQVFKGSYPGMLKVDNILV